MLRTKGIDFRTNTGHDDNRQDSHILVEAKAPAKEIKEILSRSGINLKFIKTQQVPEFAKPMANLYGGFGIAPTSAGSPNCTSGFAAITSSGVRGVLTAGHCDPNIYYAKGDGTVWRNIPFFKEAYSGSYDVQFHTASAFTVSNRVLGEPTARVTGSFDANQQEIGYVACKYGMITGKTCGKTTTLTDTHFKFPAGPKTYIRVTCSAGVSCAKRGDSGAPVYFKPLGLNILVAAGILSGGDDVYNTFFGNG
ncbi:MAG: hypothetical protein ABL925_13765 [Methylococcales bacterium]